MTATDRTAEAHTEPGSVRQIIGPLVMDRFGVSTAEFLARYKAGEYENLQDADAQRASLLAPFALATGRAHEIVAGHM